MIGIQQNKKAHAWAVRNQFEDHESLLSIDFRLDSGKLLYISSIFFGWLIWLSTIKLIKFSKDKAS